MSTSKKYQGFTCSAPQSNHNNLEQVGQLLESLDPDLDYPSWLWVLMGVFYESRGSEEGFELAKEWSSMGHKYKGEKEIRSKWRSFNLNHKKPVTIGTLKRMVSRNC